MMIGHGYGEAAAVVVAEIAIVVELFSECNALCGKLFREQDEVQVFVVDDDSIEVEDDGSNHERISSGQ
jgi:hypothetical protein